MNYTFSPFSPLWYVQLGNRYEYILITILFMQVLSLVLYIKKQLLYIVTSLLAFKTFHMMEESSSRAFLRV